MNPRILLATLVLVLGGCANTHPAPETAEHEGQLHVADPPGGVALNRPANRTGDWWATVGSITLCSDQQVRVLSVDPAWTVPPVGSRITIRRWSRTNNTQRNQDPIGSALGTPPRFNEPYASLGPLSGRFATRLDSIPVTQPCPKHGLGRDVTELLISMHVSEHGADVHRITITYRADGKEHRRVLTGWRYIACGDQIAEPQVCPAGQHAPGVESSG